MTTELSFTVRGVVLSINVAVVDEGESKSTDSIVGAGVVVVVPFTVEITKHFTFIRVMSIL